MALEIDAALVLAAGRGRRMGVSKALLEFDGSFLLHQVARAYLDFGLHSVHAVVNDEVAEALNAQPPLPGLILHGGADAQAPMMDSVRRALDIAWTQEYPAFFLQPVDSGPPGSEVLRELQSALRDCLVVKPTYRGKGGHPLALTREVVKRICSQPEESLRTSLQRLDAHELRRVEVDERTVLRNWNAPEDLVD
jgi:CTP:molybdopterin cytidylyltransferase MocA